QIVIRMPRQGPRFGRSPGPWGGSRRGRSGGATPIGAPLDAPSWASAPLMSDLRHNHQQTKAPAAMGGRAAAPARGGSSLMAADGQPNRSANIAEITTICIKATVLVRPAAIVVERQQRSPRRDGGAPSAWRFAAPSGRVAWLIDPNG